MAEISPFGLFLNPLAWLTVLLFSIVGLVFSLPTFYLGRKGMEAIHKKFPKLALERLDQMARLHERFGSFLLLLTALPGFGTLLPATAGASGTHLAKYLLWVFIAKLVRYWVLAFVFFGGYKVVTK